MVAIASGYHALTVARLTPSPTSSVLVVKAYSLSQLVRYLPGKVWGVVYESNSLSNQVAPRYVITANLIQALLTNLMAVGFSALILLVWLLDQTWLFALAIMVVGLVEFLHRKPLLEQRVIIALTRIFGDDREDVAQPPPLAFWGSTMLILEWVAYVTIWWLILGAELGIGDVLILAAYYAMASVLSIAALAVPGGIAVREALFIALASTLGIDQSLLLSCAAAMRVVLTAAEVALVCIIFPVSALVQWQEE
jgi:uncharacterized membrane protein YbhN (UPF0104 family)